MHLRSFTRAGSALLIAALTVVAGPLAGSAGATEPVVVFEDNFDDGSLDGWSTYGPWGAQCSGSACVAADTPYGWYWNYMSAGMSRTIVLPEGASDCTLTFDHWGYTESYYDPFSVYVSSAAGWYNPVYVSGWWGWTASAPVAGTVNLSFNFRTDISITSDGVFVDNVRVTCGSVGPVDRDGDGVADGDDAFPDDASESADADGDGTGDNADAFDDDPTETTDTDGDGVGDNGDAFPTDPTETTDTDGDGVGDNGDAFPTDATESADADGDGTGDNADVLDDDPLVGAVVLTADGVCGVVQGFVTKAGVANSLCVKLAAGSFGAFGNELRAQTGKALTAPQAASLRSLVGLID